MSLKLAKGSLLEMLEASIEPIKIEESKDNDVKEQMLPEPVTP